jgi:hypothetical protein
MNKESKADDGERERERRENVNNKERKKGKRWEITLEVFWSFSGSLTNILV